MPQVKPQELKSLNTIALQPDKMSSRIEMIILMDLAGKGTNDIARELGLTAARISVIKGSPMYIQARERQKYTLHEMYRDKQTDRFVSGDPVEQALKDAALRAAQKKIQLMESGKSEFVQLAAAGDVLDRAGYRPHQEKTKVSIEITDKMATRFEEALKYGMGRPVAIEADPGDGGESVPRNTGSSREDAKSGELEETEHNQTQQKEQPDHGFKITLTKEEFI